MKFELSVMDHSNLLDLLWEHHRAQAREAVALFCAAEYLRGQEQSELREKAVEMAQTSAETRRIWACLAEQ